jgi:hypothetical protein
MSRTSVSDLAFLGSGPDEDVVCIACGASVPRTDAREYDRHGDRWTRAGKTFEYLCRPCHRECCHQPRNGLESLLVRAGAGHTDRSTFLRQFDELADEAAAANVED